MTFKTFFALASFAVIANAANYKRVACPDGVNTVTNCESLILHYIVTDSDDPPLKLHVVHLLRCAMIY